MIDLTALAVGLLVVMAAARIGEPPAGPAEPRLRPARWPRPGRLERRRSVAGPERP